MGKDIRAEGGRMGESGHVGVWGLRRRDRAVGVDGNWSRHIQDEATGARDNPD